MSQRDQSARPRQTDSDTAAADKAKPAPVRKTTVRAPTAAKRSATKAAATTAPVPSTVAPARAKRASAAASKQPISNQPISNQPISNQPISNQPISKQPISKQPVSADAPVAEAVDALRPDYWDEACRHLVKKDRILRRLIPRYAGMSLQSRGDAFATLARSIVGQQISISAAAAVWRRVEQGVPGAFTPANVLALEVEALRGCGLSMRKTEYLRDLALHFHEERLNVAAWDTWEDEAIITELTAVRGIGRWTAEMYLMFHLMRPDVLPLDDLGLIQGISRNYFSGEPVSRSDAREVAQAWKPWRTVATWYMWRSLTQPQAY